MQNMLKMDFNHLFLFMVVALVLLLAPEIAHAIPMPPGFELPETDKSRVLLKMLLGDIVDVADGRATSVTESTAVTQVLASIAPIVSITGVLLMTYTMLVGVMNTANEGETLGRKWSTIWIPARSSAAMAFILPVPTFGGLSGIQLVVVWLTLVGSGGANIVWNEAAEAFTAKPIYQTPLMVDTTMMNAIFASSACAALHEKYMKDTGYVATGDARVAIPGLAENDKGIRFITHNDKTLKNGVIQRTYNWTNQGSPTKCGSISFPVGYSPDTSLSVNAGSDYGSTFGGFFRRNRDRTLEYFGNDAAEQRIRNATALRQKVTTNYAETINSLVTRVDAVAYNMIMSPEASAKDVDRDSLYQMVQWYAQETTKVARGEAQAAVDAMAEQFKADSARDGWALAGVYFWRLVMMQEAFNEAINEGSDATAAEGLDFTDSVDMETLTSTYPGYAERINASIDYVSTVGMAGQSAAQDALDAEDLGIIDSLFSAAGRMVLGWISESSDNPLMALKNFGDRMLSLIGWILVALGLMKVLSFLPIGRAAKVGGKVASKAAGGGKSKSSIGGNVGGYMMFAMIAIVIALFVMSFMFAYYLPAIPYVIWIAAIMGWLIYTMEALIAAPLWIVMHAHPDGEGPSGSHGAPGYMILLSLILRPTLLVIGLVTSLGILYVMGWFLKETLIMSQSYLDPESSRGFFANISIIILYCAILYKIINESFEQIHSLASSVMGWIGGSAKNLGESGAQNEVKSTVIAGAGVVKQATQANMAGAVSKKGNQAVTDALGKGEGNTPKADNVMDKAVSGSGLAKYATSTPKSTQKSTNDTVKGKAEF